MKISGSASFTRWLVWERGLASWERVRARPCAPRPLTPSPPRTPWNLKHMVGTLKHLVQHTPQPLCPPLPPYPLSPPHPLCPSLPLATSLTEPLWSPGVSLRPQEAFRSLQQPWGLSQTQGPCSPWFHLPPCPLTSLGPSPPVAPWGLSEASESLGSLQQPWGISQTQGPCSHLFPLPPSHSLPLAPPCLLSLLGPWGLPLASESLGSLWKPFLYFWRLQKAQGGPRGQGRIRGLRGARH